MQTCVEYYEHCWILLEDIQVFASLVRDQFHLWWQPVTSVHLSNPWLATTQPNSLCWCVMLVALSLEKCGWWQNLTQVAIFLAHLPNKTFFGYNFSTHKWGVATRVAHDWIGYLILVMTISQSAMGLSKLAGLRDGRALVMNNLSYSTSLGVKRYGKNTGVFSDFFFWNSGLFPWSTVRSYLQISWNIGQGDYGTISCECCLSLRVLGLVHWIQDLCGLTHSCSHSLCGFHTSETIRWNSAHRSWDQSLSQ